MSDQKDENRTRTRSDSTTGDSKRPSNVPTLGFSKLNQTKESTAPVIPPLATSTVNATGTADSDKKTITPRTKEKTERAERERITPRGRERAESTDKSTTPRRERTERERSESSLQTPKTSRNLKLGTSSVVCQEATLRGDVVIGSGSVIHPKCFISADAGPIELGDNNIIEELVLIMNKTLLKKNEDGEKKESTAESEKDEPDAHTLRIGSNNVFEVGAYIEGDIGSNNTIESKAQILAGSVVGDGCTIAAGVTVGPDEHVPDNTVVCAPRNHMTAASSPNINHYTIDDKAKERHLAVHSRHIDILRRTLPHFHYMKRGAGGTSVVAPTPLKPQ